MKLSKRLRMNVSLVPEGAKVADIGCDHGYASIWLIEQNRAKKVIAMDVNEGPIERARKHVAEAGLEPDIECRRSDGTEKLVPGEVDTLMIAGMGGPLMVDILTRGRDVLERVHTLVLQPQSELGEVRRFLVENGFMICREKVCIDEGKYYFALCAKRTDVPQTLPWEKWQYRYGTYLIEENNETMRQYLLKEREICRTILAKPELAERKNEQTLEIEKKLEEIHHCLVQMGLEGKMVEKGW